MFYGNSGLNSLGVSAKNPPDTTYSDRIPTFNDYEEYRINHLWYCQYPTTPRTFSLWYLASKEGYTATWVQIYPQAGVGGGGNLRSEGAPPNIEVPDGTVDNAINVWGVIAVDGERQNITTRWIDAITLGISLNNTIGQPNTNATATEGMYKLGSSDFMHNYGTNNTALGHGTLNLGLDPVVASDNTAIGENALHSVENGVYLTALGSGALTNVIDSQYCIGLGYNAGSALTNADSDDIMIGSPGVVGDLNCIRIGQGGVGAYQQDKLFIPAVWEGVAEPGVLTGLTLVNANGKMYVDIIAPNAALVTDAAGNPVGLNGLNGEVLIGATGAAPLWKTLTAGAGIGIANGANSITISAGGIGALLQLGASDGHTALPVLAQINIVGTNLITTSVTPDLGQDLAVGISLGAAGQVIGANGAADPTWKTLGCSDGSLDVIHTAGGIDITVIGVPPVGGVNYLMDHALQHVTPTLNGIQIEQGLNITTIGDIALSKITVSVTDDVDLAGHLYATTDVKTSTGNLVSTAGNLILPNTDNAGTRGAIRFGAGTGVRYIHNYGSNNFFSGIESGNNTLTVASAINNVGTGRRNLYALTTGQYNSSHGNANLQGLTSGKYNSAYGYAVFDNLLTGNYNTGLGQFSGVNYTGAEYSNLCIDNRGVVGDLNAIRIGIQGTGDGQKDKCYIAGIYSGTAGAAPRMVVCGSDHKLSTQAIPGTGAASFVTNVGTATAAAGILNVLGGLNIGTTGAGSTVTANLTANIMQSLTSIYALGPYVLPTPDYSGNRFMHARGTSCTYLGMLAGSTGGAGGTGCVGLGSSALNVVNGGSNLIGIGRNSLLLASTATDCYCLGTNSGAALTSAKACILLGTSAGSNYDTERYNIIVGGSAGSTAGDSSVNGDSRIMRLGYKQVIDPATGVITTDGTNDTYVYGIYNRTVASTGTPVYVDHLGKLGTTGGCAFSFHVSNSLNNITGDGTIYQFGSTTGSIGVEFDVTSSLTIGGAGAPTLFTVPYDGRYQFSATVTYIIPGAMPPPAIRLIDPLYLIITPLDPADPQKSKMFTSYLPNPIVGTDQNVSEIVTTLVELKAGDIVQWSCRTSGGAKNIGILAHITAGAGIPACWATYFSGSKVS